METAAQQPAGVSSSGTVACPRVDEADRFLGSQKVFQMSSSGHFWGLITSIPLRLTLGEGLIDALMEASFSLSLA